MIFLISIFILPIIYTYIFYPLILLFLSWIRKEENLVAESKNLSVTLLISAFNEEVCIKEKIENSLKLEYENLKIIVISDCSTDSTNEIVKSFQEVELLELSERKGKNGGLNEALKKVDSDIVVFSDANSLYKKNAIKQIVNKFSTKNIGCVVGELKFTNDENAAIGEGEGLYWKYEYFVKNLESELGRLLIANGSIFAVLREVCPILYPDVANDFQIPLSVLSKGKKCVLEKSAIAIEKTASETKDEFKRKVRIINRGLNGMKKMWKDLNCFTKWQLISHKILRWLVGYFQSLIFILSAFSARENCLASFFFQLQIFFYLLASLGYFLDKKNINSKITFIPFYFCSINLASSIAIFQFLTGKKYSTWTPPKSAR